MPVTSLVRTMGEGSSVKVTLYRNKVKELLYNTALGRMMVAAKFLAQDIKNSFPVVADERDYSEPGEIPHSHRDKVLKNSITVVQTSKQVVSVVSDESASPYNFYLTFGTSNMEPRPYMEPAVERNERRIKALIERGSKLSGNVTY